MSEITYYSLNQTHIASNIDATGEYTIPHISVLRDAKNNLTNTISSVSSTIESHLSSVSSTLSAQVSNLNYEYDVGGGKLISRIEQAAGKISVNTRDIAMSDISNVAVISTDFFDEGIHSRLGFKLKDKRLYFGPYEYTDGQLTSQVSDLISFDCTDFIKDGMLMEVSCVNENPTTVPPTEGTFLRLTWNTDSGHDVVYVDVKKVIGGLYQGVAPYITVDGLNISLNAENLKSNNETGLSGYNELHRYYRWLAGLDEPGSVGVIATLSTEVDILKDLNNKGLKLVGHLQYRPDVSELTFRQWLVDGGICTDKIPNGSYLPLTMGAVGIDPDRTILSTSDGLVLGNGDVAIIHSHSNDQYIRLDDLVVGENVFVQKCGASRYEYQKLVDDLSTTSSWIDSKFGAFPDNSSILDAKVDVRVSGDLSVSNLFVDTISAVNLSIDQIDFKDENDIVSVITNLKEDKGIVQLTAETLVPTMISGLREELDKLSCTVRVLTSDSQLSDIQNPKSGDIAIVSSQMGTTEELSSKYSITGYVRKDTDGVANISGWAAMDGNYSADNVYLTSNIELWGSYSKVGNFEKPGVSGIISCAGWSVSKMFDEMLNKTIQPEISPTVPTVSLTVTGHPSSGSDGTSFEVGTKLSSGYTVAFNQGKYYQPWSGGTVNDGTQVSSWNVRDSKGNTWTTNTNSGTDVGYIQTTYTVYAKAGYEAGAIAKDNKGNDSNPPVQRQGGTTGEVSKTITCYRKTFYYVGTTYGMDEITSEFMRQSGNGHSSENGDKSSKSLTIPEGTMMVCFARIGHHDISKLKVLDTGGAMVIDATPNFSVKYLDIYGANNQYPTEYTVFYAICPSEAGYKATKYDFTIS